MKTEVSTEAMKSAPPATVAIVATAGSWSMQDWVAIATVLYIVLQAAYLGWKWYREYRASK